MITRQEWRWRAWRLGEGEWKGRGPASQPRPDVFPAKIPVEWWLRLAVFLARRKAQQQRPKPDPLAFWRSTGAFEAWGLSNGQYSAAKLAKVAHGRGLKWVAIQDSPEDRVKITALRNAFASYGLRLVVWQTRPITIASARECIRAWQPDAYIAEVETREWEPDFAKTIRDLHPNLPLAIITNFWGAGGTPSGYSQSESKRWWENGWACITESYLWNEHGYQPGLEPGHLDWTARAQLGFPETFPCFAIYRASPDNYKPMVQQWPHHSWYVAENFPEAR